MTKALFIWPSVAAGICGVALAILLGKGGPPSWWGAVLMLWAPLACLVLYAAQRARSPERPASPMDPSILLLLSALVLSFLSLSATREFFFLNWWPATYAPAAVIRSGLFRFAALTLLFIPLVWSDREPRMTRIIGFLAVASAAFCLYSLFRETGGAALYRDDHPSFMFRFWAFAQSLPSPTYYNPFWNGGRIETAAISSGLQALGLVFWPFWRFLPTHDIYTALIGLALAGFIPVLAAVGVRLAGGGRIAAGVAAILALSPGRFFFLWTLHYGTVPSGFSAAFILPICGTLIYILRKDRPSPWAVLVLALGLAGIASWPPGVIMVLPAAVATLVAFPYWTKYKFFLLVAGAVAAGLLLLPGKLGVLWYVNVGGFVAAEAASTDWVAELVKGWNRFLAHLSGSHVLIVFTGVLGAVFLPRGPQRRIMVITLIGLSLLAGWGLMIKPVLQLNRAGVPLIFAAILPAALWLEHLFRKPGFVWAPMKAAALALLLLGAYSTSLTYRNQGVAPYTVLNDDVEHTAAWIRATAPPDTRVLFAGPTVHAYAGGHVAYLPVLTERAMMACDYYHFSPKLVEYEYPPKVFRENDDTIFAFFDLYNVSAVLTYHDRWKEFFRRHPDRFEETGVFGPAQRRVGFRLVRPPPGWFLQGRGSVRQTINALHITVEDPDTPVVLRFDWVNGFVADRPVALQPYDAGRGVRLIQIDPRGHASFTLRWSQWQRGVQFAHTPGHTVGGELIGSPHGN